MKKVLYCGRCECKRYCEEMVYPLATVWECVKCREEGG